MDDLEARVAALQQEYEELKVGLLLPRHSQNCNQASSAGSSPRNQEAGASPTRGDLAFDIGLLSLEGASERKYVVESSGAYIWETQKNSYPVLIPMVSLPQARRISHLTV